MRMPGFTADAVLELRGLRYRGGGSTPTYARHPTHSAVAPMAEQSDEVIVIHGNCLDSEIQLGEGANKVCINPLTFWGQVLAPIGPSVPPLPVPPGGGGGGRPGDGTHIRPPRTARRKVCGECIPWLVDPGDPGWRPDPRGGPLHGFLSQNGRWCYNQECVSTGSGWACNDGPLYIEAGCGTSEHVPLFEGVRRP